MRRFFVVLLVLILACSSAGASSLNFDFSNLSKDFLIEHRCFLTADTDDYAEVTTFFYGHDTHKVYQINIETLFDKRQGYTVEALQNFDPEEVFPEFHNMPFASMSVDETSKAVIYLVSFSQLNNPEYFRQAVQNGILTGDFPDDYADVETLIISIEGRELTMLEYGEMGLHFEVK